MKTFLALFSLHLWQQGSIQQKILVSVIAIVLVVVIAAVILNAFKARRHPSDTAATLDAASNTERSLEDVSRSAALVTPPLGMADFDAAKKVQVKPTTVVVDMTHRGVDTEVGSVEILQRGKSKKLIAKQKGWVRRRQAIEPVSGASRLTTGWTTADSRL